MLIYRIENGDGWGPWHVDGSAYAGHHMNGAYSGGPGDSDPPRNRKVCPSSNSCVCGAPSIKHLRGWVKDAAALDALGYRVRIFDAPEEFSTLSRSGKQAYFVRPEAAIVHEMSVTQAVRSSILSRRQHEPHSHQPPRPHPHHEGRQPTRRHAGSLVASGARPVEPEDACAGVPPVSQQSGRRAPDRQVEQAVPSDER